MISANGGLPAHRYTPQVTPIWPRGSEPASAVSWATWLLFPAVPAGCVVLLVRCPGPLGSCSPVCPLGALLCVCGVLGHLAPVHWCARSVCCVACSVSWATWILFTGVPAGCVVLLVRCPGPLGSCSLVCPLGALPVCAVSLATWLLFTGVPVCRVVLLVRCPGPLGSCSPVCPLGVLFCLCGVLGHLALVHRCTRSVRCLCVRCAGPLGSLSPVCPLGALFCLCGVLGHLAPVHRCACSVCCVVCASSWAPWLLFTGALAWCAVRCPGQPGSCSPVCPLGVLFCLCGVLGHRLLFTVVPARCVACVCGVLGHLASWSPSCPLGASFCLCGVLGHLPPVHRCARLVRCFACAVSWATWLLFTGVHAQCVVLRVRCPGPLGSCSPVRSPGVLCGVLGHLAPVLRCVVLWVACTGLRCGALTCPSGRRLFVAGRDWVPSGRTRVHPDGGCSWQVPLASI